MFRVEILFSWYNTWNTLQYKQKNKFFKVFKSESWLAENILQRFATRATRWYERRCPTQKYVFSWEFPLLYFKLLAVLLSHRTLLRPEGVNHSQVRGAACEPKSSRGISDVTRSRRAGLRAPPFGCVRIRVCLSVIRGPKLIGHWGGGRASGAVSAGQDRAKSRSVPA